MKKPSTLQFRRRPYSVNYLHGFWTAWLKEIIIGARTKVRFLTEINNRPPRVLPKYFSRAIVYIKGFRLRWEHLIIAFLLGALLFSSRTGRVFPDGLDIPHQAPKPIALMADTKLQPQAQVEAIYVAPPPPPAPVAVTGGCQTYWSGDYYLDNIIRFESGGNSCATNYLDCFGLLQACPGAPLRDACGGNPACQIQWFIDNKAGGRSWAQIWQHELDFGWW